MKERPILFSAPMVRALLDGTKTQTRRVISDSHLKQINLTLAPCRAIWSSPMPYGQPGDRLWVRETFLHVQKFDNDGMPMWKDDGEAVMDTWYRADRKEVAYYDGTSDWPRETPPWKPSIYMPRVLSRIQMKVIGVRVERLHDISEADAIAEGCTKNHNNYYWGGPHKAGGLKQMATAKQAYQDLWESINGPDSWNLNPWVWVVEFKHVEGGAA